MTGKSALSINIDPLTPLTPPTPLTLTPLPLPLILFDFTPIFPLLLPLPLPLPLVFPFELDVIGTATAIDDDGPWTDIDDGFRRFDEDGLVLIDIDFISLSFNCFFAGNQHLC